ncbi:MAG: DUF5711 family protein [Lachnospiraceae bacterium]|nr:DUF5711 family protein [Lachnospiraceae bacterium]
MPKNDEHTYYDDETGQRESYKTKIRRHRLAHLYRVFLMLLLSGVVIFALVVQNNNRIFSEYEVTATAVRSANISTAVSMELGGTIFTYSRDGMSCVDSKGTAKWNQTYEMKDPMVATCGNMAAVGDYDGENIYVVNTSGVQGTISTQFPLKNLCVAANGVTAAAVDDGNITWIFLYDKSGNTLIQIRTTMSQSGYPLSMSLSPNGTLLVVSYLFVDNGDIKARVAFFNFGEVGQNEADNYVSGYDYTDTIVPEVKFVSNDSAFAAADSRLMFYTGNQKPTMKSETMIQNEIQSVHYGTSMVGVVTPDTSGAHRYILTIYDTSGETVLEEGLDMEYKDILIQDTYVVVYNDTDCLIYSLKGIKKYEGQLGGDVSLLIPGRDAGHFTVVTQTEIKEITLR